jgi:CRP/FNR family cyclic AMP-dependent transcriptional regulator
MATPELTAAFAARPARGLTQSLLPPDVRKYLAPLLIEGRSVAFAPGQKIFSQGEASDHIAIIRAGVVKITAVTASGREALLGLRGAGELVGELAAMDGRPRSATVRALDQVRAQLVLTTTFRNFLLAHPDALLAVLAAVITRLREADRRRLEFVGSDVQQRVGLLLTELVRTHGRRTSGGSIIIGLALSQEEIAGATGASREAVAKALQGLRKQGIISTGRRRIIVHDAIRLTR